MPYATVQLTGTYQLPDGTPAKGTVEIIPSERQILDDTGDVILSGRVKVKLDEAGHFSVDLPATDDVSLNPTGFGYTLVAKLNHTHLPAVSFPLPAAEPVVDVTDVTTVDPSTFNPSATYSAYVVAVEQGFGGTEDEWLATLQGPAGPTGPQGPQGPAGADGADGASTWSAISDKPTVFPPDVTDPALTATIGTAVEPKADKAKTHPLGGQYLAPVRVPTLSVVESWPSAVAPFDRLIWTESNGATLYAYGRDRSIRKSTDSGRTWTRKGFTPAEFAPVFWKTTAGSLLGFRFDWNALYRSTDDGATWTSVHTLPFKQLLGAQSIAQDLVTGYVYYAEYPTLTGLTSSTAKLWRSTNDGLTWTEFYSFPTSGAGAIDHIHTIQWDHVAQRIVISAGDSNPSAGLWRINAAGTGVEPMVLNSNLPNEPVGIPRSIGIIPTTNYIVWAADTGNVPWLCRMHRSQIGLANPVVEKVYRLNSSAWWTCRASDDGSRWVVCASGENPTYRIDHSTHLYAVEDEGATVYEIGTLRARKEDTVTLAPVGAPGNHGDVFFMQTNERSEPGTWKFALGLGSGIAIPWPQRIQVPMTKTVNCPPVTLAAGAEVVFSADTVPFRAPELNLFDAGAYGGGSSGIKCIVRVGGVDQIVVGNVNERNARQSEWGAAFQTFSLIGGSVVEFVIKNNGGSTVTAASAFATFGWGSGVGFV